MPEGAGTRGPYTNDKLLQNICFVFLLICTTMQEYAAVLDLSCQEQPEQSGPVARNKFLQF